MAAAVAASASPSIPGLSCPEPVGGASPELRSQLLQLRRLRKAVLCCDRTLLPSLAVRVRDLLADAPGPVRKLIAETIGEIGSKNAELLPELVPSLLILLNDDVPAVARQALATGTQLFRKILESIVVEFLHSNKVSDMLRSAWEWMLKLKIAVLVMARQASLKEAVRLFAVKFLESMILLYTPDPEMPLEPTNDDNEYLGFNIAWLRGGHPLLNISDLAMEASQSLELLLEQLKIPQVKSISNSMRIVFINSLSAIARKRPSFYGRVLPVLLNLDPESSVIKDAHIPNAFHALKNAFLECLKSSHSSAEPWQARISEALAAITDGELADPKAINVKRSEDLSNPQSLPPGDNNAGRGHKRIIVEETCSESENDHSAKRCKETPLVEYGTATNETESGILDSRNVDRPPHRVALRTKNYDAVHQLVSMFGALAAQGDKAEASLHILSSSIAIDLLAEVVLVNMQNLPIVCPQVEGELNPTSSLSYDRLTDKSSTLQESTRAPEITSETGSFPFLAALLKETTNNDIPNICSEVTHLPITSGADLESPTTVSQSLPMASIVSTSAAGDDEIVPSGVLNSSFDVSTIVEETMPDREPAESKLPGIDAVNLPSDIQESSEASHTSTEVQDSRDNIACSGSTLLAEASSVCHSSLHLSDAQSTGNSVMESAQSLSSSSIFTSVPVLPRLLVPEMSIEDRVKDKLQIEAFMRILDADKQVAAAGGSISRNPLLAHLGIEFPMDLDIWEPLLKYILSDYTNNEGHELALCLLNRIYRDTEQDQDFLQSRSASELYNQFLHKLAKALRDTFPASDKSLSRLLCDVPYLPDNVLKLLEELCSPEGEEKQDNDIQSGDRVTQGLSAVWNLIMLRSSGRERYVEVALQSAIHPLEEVRMKAIRLVANKLFPMESITSKIEKFANDKLHSVVNSGQTIQTSDMGGDSDNQASQSISFLVAEAQQCTSLYFALCTKKHSLLRQVFSVFGSLPETAKQAVGLQMPILVRTIASSPELLGIISDPPPDCHDLVMQVVRTLTEGISPSIGLISSVKNLYRRTKDLDVLFPILPYLSKDEILHVFPNIVELPQDKFLLAVLRIVQGTGNPNPCLSPSEILIAIHGIDPDKEGIPLKKVMDACSACFEQRTVFTQQVLAKALNQLVEQIPLPLLFMRTVIQAVGVFPGLVDFIMEIMSRLVSKQIWKYPKLWVGFLKCAIQTKPQSYSVLLQLPAPQLENALTKNPVLKAPLADHANQPNVRSTLPRSTLVVLGLVEQTPALPQAIQGQQGTEPKDVVPEAEKEASEPAECKH